jgi:hypothetical protein
MKHSKQPAERPRSERAMIVLSIALGALLLGGIVARNACRSELVAWKVCTLLTEPGVKLGPLIRFW